MPLNANLLRSSFERITEREPEMTRRFYEILFERYPEAKPLFRRNAPETQQRMLRDALVAVLDHLEDPPWLQSTLGALGAKHLDYGVTTEMYDWVGDALLATLEEIAGDDWSRELAAAWGEAYDSLAGMMLAGTQPTEQMAAAPRPS